MKYFVLFFIFIYGCGQNSQKGKMNNNINLDAPSSSGIKGQEINTKTNLINCDSVFSSKGYQVQITNLGNITENDYNSLFEFRKRNMLIFSDSIYSRVGEVSFKDFNNDNEKDILIQNISDVRSNWTFNLYLVDLSNNSLKKVKGFNEIKNPELIEKTHVIESYVSSGTNYYNFYRLLANDSIFKYDILLYDDHTDSSHSLYLKAIEELIKKVPPKL
ncbi:MAG: hypothetical protein JKY33_05670 [Bacteroidia bacterium]|nr:hypothetical protein [Bacteroidia bacterium]